MTQAASQYAAFLRDAARTGKVWTIRDGGGHPVPAASHGKRAMPFWSSLARAKKIIATVPAYASFEVVELSLEEFIENWIPGLERDGLLVGVNWSGVRALGYDIEPGQLLRAVNLALERVAGGS